MKLSDRVTVPSQVMDRSVGDETVILNLESGTYYGLDPVGARMWQLLGEGKPLGEVCDAMLAEYDVTRDRLEEDLLKLVEELAGKGLIVPR
ncbi:MAG: PqqD family protein [Candidatus Competibacteraceae bacterium]